MFSAIGLLLRPGEPISSHWISVAKSENKALDSGRTGFAPVAQSEEELNGKDECAQDHVAPQEEGISLVRRCTHLPTVGCGSFGEQVNLNVEYPLWVGNRPTALGNASLNFQQVMHADDLDADGKRRQLGDPRCLQRSRL